MEGILSELQAIRGALDKLVAGMEARETKGAEDSAVMMAIRGELEQEHARRLVREKKWLEEAAMLEARREQAYAANKELHAGQRELNAQMMAYYESNPWRRLRRWMWPS